MTSTTRSRRGDVVLVVVPFSDYRGSKLRPAVVVGAPHPSPDQLLVALSSRVSFLAPGEFILTDWETAGLNVPSKVRRFILTVEESQVGRRLGNLSLRSRQSLENALAAWLGLR